MSEFIEVLSPSALKDLKALNDEITRTISGVKTVNENMIKIKTPSGADSAIKDLNDKLIKQEQAYARLQTQLERYAQAQNRTKISANALEKSEISLAAARERQAKALEREQGKLEAANSLYQKVQQRLNELQKEYRDLATMKELGATLTDKESKRYNELEGKIKKYDTTLKAVDASMGKYQRNVGNYASGYNALGTSVSRIAQELPNAAQSFQIFAMSIGNNIAAVEDSVSELIARNKALKAEGKETTSVLSQVGSSLLSWNTALYVGIALFIAYSKEIATFTKELFGASEALEQMTTRQDEFNSSRLTGRKDAQSEIIELQKYLEVVKDDKLLMEQRQIALKALRSQYPYYFKNLSDAQILAGATAKAESELTKALEKRKEVEKKTELNVQNRQALIELNNQLDTAKKLEAIKQRDLDRGIKQGISAQALATYSNDLNKAQKARISLENQISAINKQTIKNDSDIIRLKKETIALEYQEEKTKKEAKREKYDQNSITALENQISRLKEIQGKTDAASKSYQIFSGQIALLETLLKAMKGEYAIGDSFIKPEQIIDADGVELEIDKVKKKIADLSDELVKSLNDAYGYTDFLGQKYSGFFDGLTKQQQQIYNELAAGYAEALDNGDKETAKSYKDRMDLLATYGKGVVSYMQSFTDSFVNSSGFSKTFAIVSDQVEGFGKNAKVTALAVSESFQEMFNFMSQLSQANYKSMYADLSNQKDIAIAFAGDSAAAKEEIENQYNERVRKLRRKEAEDKKAEAIMNIVIDTAQAVMATLGKTGVFGIPLTPIIIAMGLAQLAMVQSQDIPNYEDGTDNHIGGAMLINDQKGSNYQELVETPDGKKHIFKGRNVLVNAPKGTKVHTAAETRDLMMFDTSLSRMLISNGIEYMKPNIINSAMSDEQVNRIVSAVQNAPTSAINFDEKGYRKYQTRNNVTERVMNARFRTQIRNV